MSDPTLSPVGIELQDSKRRFVVRWQDGSQSSLGYRSLRLACRCALCIEEMTGRVLLDPDTVPADVGVADVREVGLYGVQISWTDGHGTGIYSWDRLRCLGDREQGPGQQPVEQTQDPVS